MKTGRLEAFSDGVLAIIITIMVLELKTPEEATLHSIIPIIPTFVSYVVSFVYIGIYWNNHHHLFQITEKVNGKILWANLHLLFWLSLIPFVSAWIGENHTASAPLAFYGFVLLMSGVAYNILQRTIVNQHDEGFALRKAVGKDLKGTLSVVLYVVGMLLTYVNSWLPIACYVFVAIMWIVPDKRIEKNI